MKPTPYVIHCKQCDCKECVIIFGPKVALSSDYRRGTTRAHV